MPNISVGYREQLRKQKKAIEDAIKPGVWVRRQRARTAGSVTDTYGLVEKIEGDGAGRVVVWSDARLSDGTPTIRTRTSLRTVLGMSTTIVAEADLPWKRPAVPASIPAAPLAPGALDDLETLLHGLQGRMQRIEDRLAALSSTRLSQDQLEALTASVIGGLTKNLRPDLVKQVDDTLRKAHERLAADAK